MGNSAFRDLWIHGLTLIINSLTVAVGLVQVQPPCRTDRPNQTPNTQPFTFRWLLMMVNLQFAAVTLL